jgi:hypothetical protein
MNRTRRRYEIAAAVPVLAAFAALYVWSIQAGDASSAGFNLGFTFMTFLSAPILGFPFGVMAATVAALIRATPPARSEEPAAMS